MAFVDADQDQVLHVTQVLSFHCARTAHVFAAKLNESMKRGMAPLKARVLPIYTNARSMGSVLNVSMTHSAPGLVTNVSTMFVYVEIHQDHVIQPPAMNAEMGNACVVIIHHALENFKTLLRFKTE